MHVTSWDGHEPSRDAAAVYLDHVGVGGRGPGLGGPLHGHLGLMCGILKEIAQRNIDVGAAVKDRAAPELDISVQFLVVARRVGGEPHVDGDPGVRLDPEARGARAAAADLFLDR